MGDALTERRQSFRLVLVLILIGAFFFVELIGARIARSDVLEADAFHLLMDVLALAISLGAMRLSSRRPSARFTFGLRRAEPLAGLANGVLVLGVAIELVQHGIEHLHGSAVPRTGVMLIVATAALVVNGVNAWLLHGVMGGHAGHAHAQRETPAHEHDGHGAHAGHGHAHAGHGHSLSMRGAWLHLLGDALGSVAAFAAGLAIRFGAPVIVDPLASFVVVAILTIGALRLIRDAGLVLLESAPAHLPVAKVEGMLLASEGITRVRSLHVWSLGSGHDAITAHVKTSSTDPGLAERVAARMRDQLGVEYVTVQVELES